MKFESFYSSSSANFYVVTAANGKRLLIECGCTWKKLLKALDYKLENVVGCLLTHEHQDHAKAVEDVLEAGIDVFASAGTFKALGVEHRKATCIANLDNFYIQSEFRILPFDVHHDAAEPLGFIVHDRSSNEALLFVTDTSHIEPRFAREFNIIAICCSYDGELLAKLEAGDKINTELAKRLLESHMSKETTKHYLGGYYEDTETNEKMKICNLGKCTEIHLLHMSGSNIDKEKIRAEIEDEFFIKTLIAGS